MSPRWKSTVDERFWSRVDRTNPSGCWIWHGASQDGYGVVHEDTSDFRKRTLAHRYAYEKLVGPIPDGLVIDHLCRNPSCVNPAHIEPVTIAENTRRGALAMAYCRKGHPRPIERRAAGKHCLSCKRLLASREAVCIHCGLAHARSNMRRTEEGWICGPNLACYRQRYGTVAA